MSFSKKIFKIIIVIISLVITILIAIIIYFYVTFREFSPIVSIDTLTSKKTGEKIFIKSKTWGLLGGAHLIVISNSSEKEFNGNPITDYIYKGSESFLYNFQNDTLRIYTTKESEIPADFKSEIVIIQNEIPGWKFQELKENDKTLLVR
ncbi:MAG: hypothetical protein IAE65_13165 [Ignavibacteria bacterium]|nr:hypothetical protein [Ignavibacteria bacterium]